MNRKNGLYRFKDILLILFLLLVTSQSNISAQQKIESASLKKLEYKHDLSLPDWGPYTKRYIGISHIPNVESGLRFDLSVFPGLYRRKVNVPNVLYENDYHPWDASPNFEYFSFRHELVWKDQVYTDISYSEIDDNSRLIRIECVNNTDNNENLALHFMASMNFPPIKEYSPYTPIYPAIVTLPESAVWYDALDYENLEFAIARPTDNLVYDGKMRGEIRDNNLVNGSGIGVGFGKDKGDFVTYKINTEQDYKNVSLLIRYKTDSNATTSFTFSGLADKELQLKSNKNDFEICTLNLGKLGKGTHEFTITSNGGSAIQLDGFILTETDEVDDISFKTKVWNPVPQINDGPTDNSIILKYEDVDLYYGLLWQYDDFEIREWFGRDISDYFKQMVNEHNQRYFYGEGKGHYTNAFLRPIVLNAKSTKVLYGIVCCGTKEEVEEYLSKENYTKDKCENIYLVAKSSVISMDGNEEGEKYKFSIERMNATLNCNVVYPLYSQKQYTRQSVPGRWWDCLYTWDSGFIGMGYLQTDTKRAIENLNAYTQAPGEQSAFIHHGTPVPTQHYLFMELWEKTQSKELLEYFYPRLKQYHEFMAGRFGSSTTRVLKSNILKTWDYFYNSGGWDDLPPQKYNRDNKMEKVLAPVITSSQVIRTAKFLKMVAKYLGKDKDIKEYDDDIKTLSNALQKYSWDEKTGYFGYVLHDEDGNPLHILNYKDTINYNMTFDGAYPLIAGICTAEQKERILSSLKSDKHIWSNAGLSAIDQSAPYYSNDGYWNGTVWMAHQWFFWKTMLDLGESDFAYKIATKGLDVWKNEVETSYNCMEHFIIETGRGAGWHEFGALSSPVVIWYSAYFRPGNFTTGFDTWVENKKFDNDFSSFSADLSFEENSNNLTSVIVSMNPKFEYNIEWNGKNLTSKSLAEGTLSIDIPIDEIKAGKLKINKK